MKNKNLIAILSIICIFIGGYIVYNYNFPYAEPIVYPKLSEINEYKIYVCDGQSEFELEKQLDAIMNYIKKAKPTRDMSVSERPNVTPYYYISLESDNQVYTYYIYKKNSKVYIEIPYYGIYTIDEKVLDFLS